MTFEQSQKQTDKAIERLAGKHQKSITREYAKALKEIRSKLATAYEKHAVGKELTYAEMSKYNRLANLEEGIFKEVNKLTGKNATKLKHSLGEVYQESYQRTAFNVEREVQAKLAFGKLDPKTIEAAVENPLDKVGFLKRNRSNQDRLKDQLSSELTQGLIKGESYQDVARRLKKRMDVGATNMDRIAQTEMHRCHMQGKRKGLDHAESKGVKMRYQWVATLDQRTRDTHQDYDGMLTVTDDGKQMFDLPGIGLVEGPGMTGIAEEDINCRCAMIGVIEGYEPKVRRSREEGKIPYQAYREYAKDKGWDVKWDGPEPRLTLKDKVDAEIAKGTDTEEDMRRIGATVSDEVETKIQSEQKAINEEYSAKIDQARRDALAARRDMKRISGQGELTDEQEQEYARLRQAFLNGSHQEINLKQEMDLKLKEKRLEVVRESLSQVRSVGAEGKLGPQPYKPGSSQMCQDIVNGIRENLPTDWVEASNRAEFKVIETERGYWSVIGDEMSLGRHPDERTAYHEMGHRIEDLIPDIKKVEYEFYKRRTAGSELEWLGPGHEEDEMYREGGWIHNYMGKDYTKDMIKPEKSYFELFSMGLEGVYTGRHDLNKDPEYRDFIYGILATK